MKNAKFFNEMAKALKIAGWDVTKETSEDLYRTKPDRVLVNVQCGVCREDCEEWLQNLEKSYDYQAISSTNSKTAQKQWHKACLDLAAAFTQAQKQDAPSNRKREG